MRYYINLDVRLESKGLLPGSFDFRLGAVFADETTGIFINPSELPRRSGGNTCHQLDSPFHK